MKALSIRQPWAYAILRLGKRVENRDWKGCGYRGPVLLHASKTLVLRDFDEEIDSIIDIVNPKPGDERLKLLKPLAYMSVPMRGKRHGEGTWRPAPSLPLGGIVGRARIVDVIHRERDVDSLEAIGMPPKDSACSPWYAGGFALVLAEVEPLPFIPWRGSLGLFDVPDAVAAALLSERDLRARGEAPSDHCALPPGPCALSGPSRACNCRCGPCVRAVAFDRATAQARSA